MFYVVAAGRVTPKAIFGYTAQDGRCDTNCPQEELEWGSGRGGVSKDFTSGRNGPVLSGRPVAQQGQEDHGRVG